MMLDFWSFNDIRHYFKWFEARVSTFQAVFEAQELLKDQQ